MKFRTKIWMLPACAALVFVVGSGVSYVVGARTSAALHQLAAVDSPALEQVQRIDRGIEQFRLTLQSAAAEGDVEKLKDVQATVDRTHEVLDKLGAIEGKAPLAKDLRAAFDAYQAPALAATRAMLNKTELGDLVQRMQAAQAELDKQVKARVEEAAKLTVDLQSQADHGVRNAIWVNVCTGIAVLLALGVASRLIVGSVWRDLGEEPDELHRLMARVAEGDLQSKPRLQPGDERSLNAAIAQMVSRLRETIGTIRLASDSMATASDEIAAGNQDLSARTESTASNLQETASSMARLTDSVRHSADAAGQANQLASAAAQAAQRGGSIVEQVVDNMAEINTASRKIGEIIAVIDGIAFQTNILALNAAVEAARAGEQGRGFAVVAGEVRTLAQRSAQAAREIKTLISASSEKVESGSTLVRDAGAAMQEIVGGVQRVTDIIGEISEAAREQSSGIVQVNQSVVQLDAMTQQNAALVEESAAAAESLRVQAGHLASAVASFRTDGAAAPSVVRHAAAPVATPVKVLEAPAAKPVAPQAAAPKAAAPQPVAAAQDEWASF